jgi:hypothetical protein
MQHIMRLIEKKKKKIEAVSRTMPAETGTQKPSCCICKNPVRTEIMEIKASNNANIKHTTIRNHRHFFFMDVF